MGFITNMFKTPKINVPPPPPPPPAPPEPTKQASERISRNRDDLRRRAAMMGSSVTNTTGALGLQGEAPTAKKRLLGQ